MHAASPLMVAWHRANADALHLPELYEIDEVIAVFEAAGFDAAAARLAMRLVPTGGHGHHDRGRVLDWLDYYHDQSSCSGSAARRRPALPRLLDAAACQARAPRRPAAKGRKGRRRAN
ncbi:MAG: hypothetical protein ACR2IP_11405 [Solirubrobacteraceae bacterium]